MTAHAPPTGAPLLLFEPSAPGRSRGSMENQRPAEFPPELGDEFFHRLVLKAHLELRRMGITGGVDPYDVAEDALIGIFQLWLAGKLETTCPDVLLRGLAGTIVQRRAIDAGRKIRARREVLAPDREQAPAGTREALDAFPAGGTGPSTRARRLDARERLSKILRCLGEHAGDQAGDNGDYEAFVLHHADGLTFEEVAQRRGKGESSEAVRSRIRRIERWIRERLSAADGC